MKVPTLDAPQVGPQQVGLPTNTAAPPSSAGLMAGLTDAGRTVDIALARAQRERDKAIAAETTDGETQLTRGITEDLNGSTATEGEAPAKQTGFFSLKGREAESNAAGFMERIEKRRKAIADGFATAEVKKLFLERTGKQVEHARSSIEQHTATERQRADVASLTARKAAALESIRANLGNGAAVEQQSIALEGPIRALSLSPEDAERDVHEWQQSVVLTQLGGLLEGGNWQAAEALYDDRSKALLGDKGKAVSTAITKVKNTILTEDIVSAAVRKSMLPNGQVDEASALRVLDSMPPEQRAVAEPLLNQHLVREKNAWNSETERIGRESYTAVNNIGWKAFSLTEKANLLNERDPKLWDQLRNADQRDLDRLERKSRMRLNNAQAKAEQDRIDRIAVNEWTVEIANNPNADRNLFLSTHRGISDDIPSALEKLQAVTQKTERAGLSQSRAEFVADYMAEAENRMPAFTGKQSEVNDKQAEWKQAQRAAAINLYTTEMEAKGGKQPTAVDLDTGKAGLLLKLPMSTDPAQLRQHIDALGKATKPRPERPPARPAYDARVQQLKAAGKTKDEARAILKAEGY